MANDLDALDRLFAPGTDTLRGDAAGLLVGHDQISAFRGGRGGAPQRTIVQTHVQASTTTTPWSSRSPSSTAAAAGSRPSSGRAPTAAGGSPRPTSRCRPRRSTPASGGSSATRWCRRPGPVRSTARRVAVKDLYAVAGPARRRRQPGVAAPRRRAEPAHAWAVAAAARRRGGRARDRPHRRVRLLASPAPTRTTAPRRTRRRRYRISGGSSSGSASRGLARATRPSGSAPTPAARSGCPRRTRGSGASAPPTALVPTDGLLPLAPLLRRGRLGDPRRRRCSARSARCCCPASPRSASASWSASPA